MKVYEEKDPVHVVIAIQKLYEQCKKTGLLHIPNTYSKRKANDKYKVWLIKKQMNESNSSHT